jgi:hypothetical protein
MRGSDEREPHVLRKKITFGIREKERERERERES